MDYIGLKKWLIDKKNYKSKSASDVVSRLKRIQHIALVPNKFDDIFIIKLNEIDEFKLLSNSVKSQIRRALKLYREYINYNKDKK